LWAYHTTASGSDWQNSNSRCSVGSWFFQSFEKEGRRVCKVTRELDKLGRRGRWTEGGELFEAFYRRAGQKSSFSVIRRST
jgi:hypothetical protein